MQSVEQRIFDYLRASAQLGKEPVTLALPPYLFLQLVDEIGMRVTWQEYQEQEDAAVIKMAIRFPGYSKYVTILKGV
jgi:hypothetical protein